MPTNESKPAEQLTFKMKVASIEIQGIECSRGEPDFAFKLRLRGKDTSTEEFVGSGSLPEALAQLVSPLCVQPVTVTSTEIEEAQREPLKIVVAVHEADPTKNRAGVGRYVADAQADQDVHLGLVIATLRAASHAGMLKASYRANNQKSFRAWSKELCVDLVDTFELEQIDELHRLEAEGIILEQMNRVASAAVVTAANYPKANSVLSLFDTSAWLFDSRGRKRDSYTDTDLWLAWYPGVQNDDMTVQQVMDSMPQSPPTKIPFVVRLFENPGSWLRFRGAVALEDHDVLHVLLGRGLQDQDEAFVLGFAMGTGKKVSWFQYHIFKFVLARIYPEPYRIPKYLQPAFDLGFQCGKETGVKDLYKRSLKDMQSMTLREARKEAGIDISVLQKYYELEQQSIPFTIASLRLP